MASKAARHDELYLREDGEDSPTIEPLRINKPASPDPPRTASASSGRYNYPPPKLTFPIPPGASSSAATLPYPEDQQTFQYPRPVERTQRAPYPEDLQDQHPPSSNSSSPSQAGSSDYGRPAAVNRKASYDTTRRLGGSPIDSRGPRLAERRGNVPKPLPEYSGPEYQDNEGLFAHNPKTNQTSERNNPSEIAAENYNQQYGGGVKTANANVGLIAPTPSGVNRFSSTASTSTTKGTRGSPAPPETPIMGPGEAAGGIEARYAAAGISGTATLSSLQAQNAAASLRTQHYATPPVPQLPTSPGLYVPPQQGARPWTPTESPHNQPHGPLSVYQGSGQIPGSATSPPQSQQNYQGPAIPSNSKPNTLEQDIRRMQITADPPPAYTSVGQSRASQGNGPQAQLIEKQRPAVVSTDFSQPLGSPALMHPGHPAFANDPQSVSSPGVGANGVPVQQFAVAHQNVQSLGPASPPPLPEGWIAHLDQNSGQFYYIHLPTQATQWEFPKGPTPLNHDTVPTSPIMSTYGNPLASPTMSTYGNSMASPGLSAFGKQPMGSPMFSPHTPGYAESIMSMASQTPSASGFTGPPPSAGVDMYKISPTNSVYFGPYLKYINMDLERGVWFGSIMVVTDGSLPPTIHIHKSVDLSPNPRQLKANPIFTHQRWTFYRYDVDLQMEEGVGDKWTYAVTSHLGCTRYEFLVAGRYETNWRFIAHSGSDFAPGTNQAERSRLGGIGYMWKDVLQKNVDCGGFHVQLGLGDQIYGDRLWKEVPLLKQWLAMSGKDIRKAAAWTAKHEEDVTHAYFHYYTSHFDQPYLREAFAQIPQVLMIDDHDIFDGYGSYPEHMQNSNMFKNIGRIGIEMYLLFQHHTTLEILRNVSNDIDLFTITGNGWHFVKFLGPAVVVVGPDCRSERNQQQVMAGPTYQGLFPKIATLPPSVQHCILMVSVPVVYPRLEAVESFATTMATGKKAVNSTYNLLGKVTSSVAGVVGGKEIVASGFSSVKKAVGKQGLMGGVLTSFGDIDIADELKDMWTHESKDLERTYLIRTLQGIANQKGIRMTFLSGDVSTCGAGLLHDPSHPSDHKTMYQVISSSIVAAPPPTYVLKMLHNNKQLYVPDNGHKSTHAVSNTKEDMMEIFQAETNGGNREMKKLMGRRNYVAFVAFDPNDIHGAGTSVFGGGSMAMSIRNGEAGYAGSQHSGGQGLAKLSLAVDFIVQGDGSFGVPTKYGPVVIPSLEFGR